MANANSDLITHYLAKRTVRTANSRGSLLVTTALLPSSEGSWGEKDAYAHLCLIPYTATIVKLEIIPQADITAGVFGVVVRGINPNFTFTSITDSAQEPGDIALVAGISTLTANITKVVDIATPKTVYEQLCTGPHFLPRKDFKPYKDTAKGVLALKCTTAATEHSTATVRIYWVEGAPSEMPLTKVPFEKVA